MALKRNEIKTMKKTLFVFGFLLYASTQTMCFASNNYANVTDARLTQPEDDNWLMYRRTYDGCGYSPLNQIDHTNVDQLVSVWSYSTGVEEGHQSPPIVNNGIRLP